MNLKNQIEPFLEYCKDIRGYSPQTIKTYKIALELLANNYEIEEKRDKTVVNIMPLRLKLSNHSRRAISTKLSAVRSFIKYLNEHKKCKIKLKGAQSIKVPKTLPKPLRREDIIQVIESSDPQTSLIIEMLYSLGLRISELSSLKLNSIKSDWIRVTGKGNKTREIPILPTLNKRIESYKSVFNPKIYLFEKNQIALNDAQLRYIITKTFAKYGIKATPHQLRHSFASDLLQEGARVSDVSELLGHSSMATTQIYTKLSNSKKLNDYLNAHPMA